MACGGARMASDGLQVMVGGGLRARSLMLITGSKLLRLVDCHPDDGRATLLSMSSAGTFEASLGAPAGGDTCS